MRGFFRDGSPHPREMTPEELRFKVDKYRSGSSMRARRFIRRNPEHFTPEEVERAQKKAP